MRTKTKKAEQQAAAGQSSDANMHTAESSSPPVVQPWLETVMIPLANLVPSPTNPRKTFKPEKQKELEESMRACGFSLSAMLVRPLQESLFIDSANSQHFLMRKEPDGEKALNTFPSLEAAQAAMAAREHMFEVVAGERRLRAALAVGVSEAPCIVRPLTDEEVYRIQLIENIQRDDLTPIEEAMGFKRLLDLRDPDGRPIHTTETLSKATGKSVRHIERLRKICVIGADPKLAEFAKALEAGVVGFSHAALLARVPDAKLRGQFAKQILEPQYDEAPLSIRKAEQLFQRDYMVDIRNSGIDMADAQLLPVESSEASERLRGGACDDCPFRVGNAKHLFDDEIPSGLHHMCMQPACFQKKRDISWKQWQERETKPEKKRRALSEKDCRDIYQYGDQISYNHDLVDLTQCPDSGDLKPGEEVPGTWRQLTKGGELEVLVVRDRNGRQHELVQRDAAIRAAIANEHKVFKVKESTDGQMLLGQQVDRANSEVEAAKHNREFQREQRISHAIRTALVRKVEETKKLPEGFWSALVDAVHVQTYGEAFYNALNRRSQESGQDLDSGDFEEMLTQMNEQQKLGLLIDELSAGNQYISGKTVDNLDVWVRLYAIDCKAIEKQVKAQIKAEEAEDAARAAIRDGMKWEALKHNVEDFDWDGAVCLNFDICRLELPKSAKGCHAAVLAGLSAKGWHYSYVVSTPAVENRESVWVPTAYDTRELALRAGMLAIKLAIKLPAPMLERIDAYIDFIQAPAAEGHNEINAMAAARKAALAKRKGAKK